jgi:dihydrolipoamide dehydrogenase
VPDADLLSCDVAIIGAGTAGLSAYDAAREAGADPILIEAGQGGTTCAAVGCMPSKLLIAAAEAARATTRLGLFGLRLDGALRVDGPAAMDRVRRERDHFVAGVLRSVDDIPAERRVRGRAKLLGPNRLSVEGGPEIAAKTIIIATGSTPAVPKPLQSLGDLILTNETVFELADLPRSLAVVGAGAVGLELALAFSRLGVRVRLLDEGDTIGGLKDPEALRALREIIGDEVSLTLGVKVESRRADGEAELSWSGESDGRETFERVLVAAGRPPNLAGLDLDRAGLDLDEHGVPVFDPHTMRCGTSAVFIAGDADGDRPVLHEASDDGAIAGRNAAHFPDVAESPRRVPFSIVYTDPEIATVGQPFPEAEAAGALIGHVDLGESGRARVMGRNAGVLRVYARPDGGLTGGVIVGPEAEHLGHLLAFMVQTGMSAFDALALPYYHPTLEESLRAALRKICTAAKSRPESRKGSTEYGPGS